MMHQEKRRKKLIEVALPLEPINYEARKRKTGRAPKGYPTAIHKYWAQRPIAICRAIIFCQLVDDPSAWPNKFATKEAQEKERMRLFDLIDQLVMWENSTNEYILNKARFEIARSIAWSRGEEPPAMEKPRQVLNYLQKFAPPVYDPFSGGGSIPLEAQRLGLCGYGSDLNPVAVLIGKALVEIPPKFAGQPPVNPSRDPHVRWRGAQGLANDVRYYGQWMRDQALKRIGKFYPEVEVTEKDVSEQPSLEPLKGQKLTVVAWIWARTVATPNPAANGAQVPLVSSFMLSIKGSKKAWVEPKIDPNAPDGYRFVVRSGRISKEDQSKKDAGTIGKSTGGYCILTGAPVTLKYVRKQGQKNRLGQRLMAIVADSPCGRVFISASDEQERSVASVKLEWEPEGYLSEKSMRPSNYGLLRFADLFTPRQLVALTTFSDLVSEAREEVLAVSLATHLPSDSRLADGGTGAEAYADAVATYLAFSVDRIALNGSSLAGWRPDNKAIRDTMPRQRLSMSWDYVEGNPFGNSSCDLNSTLDAVVNCIDSPLEFPQTSHIFQASALEELEIQNCVISTDPPYYDNVGYADLSDFFYVWLRRMLRDVWPKLFTTLLVPKADELVATPYRHGGNKEKAKEFFMHGMEAVLKQVALVTNTEFPITIYYAFKQSEAQKDEISSTGWSAFLQAIANNDLIIDGTWPMKSEGQTRSIAQGANALSTSIVLVCRKRRPSAPPATRREFLRTLKQELPAALKLLKQGNVAPVDMAQASIGPGMEIFTRYAKVLEARDDSPMKISEALKLINSTLDEFDAEQEGDYDKYTRFAVTWFKTHGMQTAEYGAAETLATARNVSVDGVRQAGLIRSGGGMVRLLPRSDMPADWDPANDLRPTVWKATQHLIRCLEGSGEPAAANLLRRLGSRADPARDLAYRLYQICERNDWSDEGRAYNGLVIAWPELVKLAQQDIQVSLI